MSKCLFGCLFLNFSAHAVEYGVLCYVFVFRFLLFHTILLLGFCAIQYIDMPETFPRCSLASCTSAACSVVPLSLLFCVSNNTPQIHQVDIFCAQMGQPVRPLMPSGVWYRILHWPAAVSGDIYSNPLLVPICFDWHPSLTALSLLSTASTRMLSHCWMISFLYTSSVLFMAVLCRRCGHYIFALWFLLLSSIFFLSSPNLSRRRLDVCHTCTHGVALVRI